jgi:hypothetical protein
VCVIVCLALSVPVCFIIVACFMSDCHVTDFWIYEMYVCMCVCMYDALLGCEVM